MPALPADIKWFIQSLDHLEALPPPVCPPKTPPHEELHVSDQSLQLWWIWRRVHPDLPDWFGHGYRTRTWFDEPCVVDLERLDFYLDSTGTWDTSFIRRRAVIVLDTENGKASVRNVDPTRVSSKRDVRAGMRMVTKTADILRQNQQDLKAAGMRVFVAISEWSSRRSASLFLERRG